MRTHSALFFATAILLGNAALAAAPTVPSAAVNPTVPALSVDRKLANDNDLNSDAATLAGVEGQTVEPGQVKVNADHHRIDQLNQQLKHDTTFRASKTVIKDDKTAISNATKQLKLDATACQAEVKADGSAASSTMCK